jgi:hypothetical protein
MSFSYDPTTAIGQIRLISFDSDATNVQLQDEDIAAFLSLENNSVRRAAAMVLDRLAVKYAMVQGAVKLLDLECDGTKVAQEFRAQAKDLRRQEEVLAQFDVAEMVLDEFTYRERVIDEALRNNTA